MKTVLVTGAAGLIGSHLCDVLLERGYKVIGVDNLSYGSRDNLHIALNHNNFSFIESDVENIFIHYFLNKIDAVFHLAAYKKAPKGADISSYDIMKGNYNMMDAVLEICKNYKKPKLIFTSTSDIYGNSHDFNEDEQITIGPPTVERYSYALSKLFDEQMVLNLINENKIEGTILRIFGCFSERSNKGWSGGHVPMFIDRALKGEDILIHGDGLQTRSMCDAVDIAKGIADTYESITDLNGEIINIGTSEEMPVRTAAELIIQLTNSNSKIVHQNEKEVFGDYKEIERRFANTEKAKKLIDFKINSSTTDVIKRIINDSK